MKVCIGVTRRRGEGEGDADAPQERRPGADCFLRAALPRPRDLRHGRQFPAGGFMKGSPKLFTQNDHCTTAM